MQIVISAACFGLLGIFGKQAFAAGITPGELLSLRFAIASLILWSFVLLTRPHILSLNKWQILTCAILGIFGYALFTSFYFEALVFLSASLAVLLLYTFPVIVTIGAWILFKERISLAQILALPIVMLGLVLLLSGGTNVIAWQGVVLGLLSAIFYSAYVLASSRLLRSTNALAAGLYIMTFAALIMIFRSPPDVSRLVSYNASAWIAILGLALVSTVLAMILFLKGLEKLTNAEASMLSTIEPLTATILAAIVLGETLSPLQIAGGALVLAALVASSLRSSRQRTEPV
ncbi:MAG: DMT family transporter [Acidobacteriota bacterium]|nr:DMT family transporter [Acidobacteriota bacterium]